MKKFFTLLMLSITKVKIFFILFKLLLMKCFVLFSRCKITANK